MIDSIKVVRRGQVRRAKLYYLRGLRGKSARITERQEHGPQGEAARVKAAEVVADPRKVIIYSAHLVEFRDHGQAAHPLRQDLGRPPRR